MPLSSTDKRHAQFFDTPAILLDTSALIEFVKRPEGIELFNSLLSSYALLVPTPAIYELSFGPRDKLPPAQEALESLLPEAATKGFSAQNAWLNYAILQREHRIFPGTIIVINPDKFEWMSARLRLVRRITRYGGKYAEGKAKHSFDALICSCARNFLAPICTENVRDFEHFNIIASEDRGDGSTPIFTVDQTVASINSLIVYCPPVTDNR